MTTELNDRERKEVALAQVYATHFAHGTAGHNGYMTLAKVAQQAGYFCDMGLSTPTLHRYTGTISDGHHTFDELYEHRCLLFVWLMNLNRAAAFKTRKHADGSEFDGWFVGIIRTEAGEISYHLPNLMWDMVLVPEIERHDTYDGSDARAVLERLRKINSEGDDDA